MKFLLDLRAASRSLQQLLADLGHDVLTGWDLDPRATDEELLALARREGGVLVTKDKDFGELVFVLRQPHPCIVRLVDMRVADSVTAMRELIEHHADAMRRGDLIVVTPTRGRSLVQKYADHFLEVDVQFLKRLALAMRAREARHVARVEPRIRAALHNRRIGLHPPGPLSLIVRAILAARAYGGQRTGRVTVP